MERIIFIASDHAGFELKEKVCRWLKLNKNFKVTDLGPNSTDSVDYPDFANKLSSVMKTEPNSTGVLICGSGQGMAIRANKYSWIRAALVYSKEIAVLSREHNDANVICLGSRFCTESDSIAWVNEFLSVPFAGGRHATRVAKLSLDAKGN